MMRPDDLFEQSRARMMELVSIFGIGPYGDADGARSLGGLLKDCADAGEDSCEMVRSVRDGQ